MTDLPKMPRAAPGASFYHGGVPGLEVGDLLVPGFVKPSRPSRPPSGRVVATTIERDARQFATYFWPEPHEPGGDLYEVEPDPATLVKGLPDCDAPERYACQSARIVRVIARGITPQRSRGRGDL